MNFEEIEPKEAAAKQDKGALLIDVRTQSEFDEVHAKGAIHLPLDQLTSESLSEAIGSHKSELLFICLSGGRSRRACELMSQHGFSGLINIKGGTKAWVELGLPIDRS